MKSFIYFRMLQKIVLALILGVCLAFPDANNNAPETIKEPLVTLSLGKIKGSTLTTRLGKTIFAFRGVRYAKAPLGELRFRVS